jgi:cytochrome bd-type quinol oxidase subunit 2
LRRVGQWIDRNLWILPFLSFLLTELVLTILHYTEGDPLLLAKIKAENRKEIYSSLTGSSSGLLGFALAAVAIMAAFGRRSASTQDERQRENQLADARVGISKILLATSLFLMTILVTATVAIGIDDQKDGSFTLTSVITSSVVSSLLGLFVSCAGLVLSLAERSRER